MTDILMGVISAMVTVVITLAAVMRFYLPRVVNRHNSGNPGGWQHLIEEVRAMRQADLEHHAREEAWQNEMIRTLERVEGRLSS